MKQSEYYYGIMGLLIPHPAPITIDKDINRYIDNIEGDIKVLEDTLKAADIKSFRQHLKKTLEMLCSVYANWLEVDGDTLLRTSSNENYTENCQRLLKSFIIDLRSLSIDMQKAQSSKSDSVNYTDEEKFKESAQNMSAVSTLIKTGNYGKAESMVSEMQNNSFLDKADNVLAQLASALKAREYDKAGGLANAKYNEYMNRIKDKRGTEKNILAVDDRPEILNVVNTTLSSYYKVLVASNGNDAIKIMDQHKIDLFILDIEMPGMDGFELTDRIREKSNYASTPIIFFTADSSRERIKQSMELGISEFIVKPSYPETLLVQAARYLMG